MIVNVFVNNGLLREGEFESTLDVFRRHLNLNVKVSISDIFTRNSKV